MTSENGIHDSFDGNDFDILDIKISILRELIDHINGLKLKRQRITEKALRQIDDELDVFLVHLQEVAPDKRLSEYMQTRRIHIEKSISRLRELKRSHEVKGWSDIIILEKELLNLLSEYRTLKALRDSMD